jgi:hypothetical protein
MGERLIQNDTLHDGRLCQLFAIYISDAVMDWGSGLLNPPSIHDHGGGEVGSAAAGDLMGSRSRSETLEHHMAVHESMLRILEGGWQRSDNLESVPFPQPDRGFIGGDHQIELHAGITELQRDLLRVFAHPGCDAFAAGPGGNHISAIADVAALAGLIRFDIIGSRHYALLLADESGLRGIDPRRVCLFLGDVPRIHLGAPFPKDRFKEPPRSLPIAAFVRPYHRERAKASHRGIPRQEEVIQAPARRP